MTLALLWFACGGPAPADTDLPAEGTDRLTAPDVVAVWSAEEAAAALDAHLAGGIVDPRALPGWIEPLVAGIESAGAPGCPVMVESIEGEVTARTMAWRGTCLAFDEPFGGVWHYSTRVTANDAMVEQTLDGLLSFDFTGADGVRRVVGAFVIGRWSTSRDEAHRALQATVGGTFRDAAGPAWMADADLGLDLHLMWDAGVGVSGEIVGAEDLGGAPGLYYEGVLFDPRACRDYPASGAVSVRDPSGGWWRAAVGPSCGPCGALSFAGEDHGEICVAGALADAAAALFAAPDPQP